MNATWIALLTSGIAVGFLIAWFIRRRDVRAKERIIYLATQAKTAVETELSRSQTESAGIRARLEEKSTRITDLESAVKERDAQLTVGIAVRERVAQLLAEAEGLRKNLEKHQSEFLNLQDESRIARERILELTGSEARLVTELEAERLSSGAKLTALQDAQVQLREAFTALSAEALRANNQSFIELAKAQMGEFQAGAVIDLDQRKVAINELVAPIRDSLEKVDTTIQAIERTRSEAYGSLTAQLQTVADTQHQLHAETSNLVNALRSPSVRGRWGEMQLRRVVELAGMIEHCDFTEQPVAASPDSRVRPDLIVHLPMGKQIIVDAKVPLEAYLKALEAPDEPTRLALLQAHARQVRDHMTKLSSKNYCDQFENTPDHVVMFIPGEVFFFTALQHDPELIEYGVSKGVFVAGPMTLISLLRAVSYGWRQERIAENAEAISRNGRELYDRIGTLADHIRKLGGALDRSVETYNQMIGSFETRVLVSARRFKDLGPATGGDLEQIESIDCMTRQIQAAEFGEEEDMPTRTQEEITFPVVDTPEEELGECDNVPF